MKLLSQSFSDMSHTLFLYKETPSYKEAVQGYENIDTDKNLKELNDTVVDHLKGKDIRVNTKNSEKTASIYNKRGKVIDGIGDGQPVKVLDSKRIDGDIYLQVGYNVKEDGSYVGVGYMKSTVLHEAVPAGVAPKGQEGDKEKKVDQGNEKGMEDAKEVGKLKKENKALQEKVKKLEGDKSVLQKLVEKANELAKTAQEAVGTLKEQLSKKDKRIQELEKQLKAANDKLRKIEEKKGEWEDVGKDG